MRILALTSLVHLRPEWLLQNQGKTIYTWYANNLQHLGNKVLMQTIHHVSNAQRK